MNCTSHIHKTETVHLYGVVKLFVQPYLAFTSYFYVWRIQFAFFICLMCNQSWFLDRGLMPTSFLAFKVIVDAHGLNYTIIYQHRVGRLFLWESVLKRVLYFNSFLIWMKNREVDGAITHTVYDHRLKIFIKDDVTGKCSNTACLLWFEIVSQPTFNQSLSCMTNPLNASCHLKNLKVKLVSILLRSWCAEDNSKPCLSLALWSP